MNELIKVPERTEIAVRVLRFYSKPKAHSDGSVTMEDWVDYARPGEASRSVTPMAIRQCMKTNKWQIFGPQYEAWKAGREPPVDGTPLAAWPGVVPEYAEVLRGFNVKSVEQVAELNETLIAKIQIPNIRSVKQQARAFLASKDQAVAAAVLVKKDDEITALRAEMDELKAMLRQGPKTQPVDDDIDALLDDDEPIAPPRRRGRPPGALNKPKADNEASTE